MKVGYVNLMDERLDSKNKDMVVQYMSLAAVAENIVQFGKYMATRLVVLRFQNFLADPQILI